MNPSPFQSPISTMSARDVAAAVAATLRYCGGDGQPVPSELLRRNLMTAAEGGDVDAAVILASGAETGILFGKDADEAMKWRVFAVEGGHVPSMIAILSLCVRCADHGDSRSYEYAYSYLRKMADVGVADAVFYVGFCLDHGIGVAADAVQAVRCYRKAADRGSIPAKFWLAVFRLAAGYLPSDPAEAQRLCLELDQALPPRRYGDYSAWPPFCDYVKDIAMIYDWLADDASKRNYLREMLFLLVSEYSPYWSPESRNVHAAAQRLLTTFSNGDWQKAVEAVRADFDRFPSLVHNGVPCEREEAECAMAGTYVVEQYRYGGEFDVKSGDVAMCCGACLGDSTLWLAGKTGPTGKVFAFEPFPAIFADLQRNLQANHADNAFPVQAAIGGKVGKQKFSFVEFGSSRLSDDGEIEVEATTVDHFCAQHGIVPDFIKMDVEGVEADVCRGARDIITRHKPRLGICLYHKPFRDMREIPLLLRSYRPDYRFYMRKCAVQGETVLYAV